jgi:drug/metabolite transporter (DMT)-like permease
MVTLPPPLYVFIGIVATSAAQIFLKIAGTHEIFSARWSIYIFLSLATYSVSFASYYMALLHFDISKISPIMMASIVSLVALYGFAVGETFNYLKVTGIAFAILAIFLISKS